MTSTTTWPRYSTRRSYAWNYQHAPEPVAVDVPRLPGEWWFCGLAVDSPLGIPAGPLLNGRWCLYYASLGFDVLTYKTVRSRARACYPLPNLVPVRCGSLHGGESSLPAATAMQGSWAVSYGMPSQEPRVWREDVAETRRQLPAGKLLAVSVVATVEDGWTLSDMADDYARCARWALESGADVVETNFSCPNVTTCDGQLFQQVRDAQVVAQRVREAIGAAPYVIKIGHVPSPEMAEQLLDAVGSLADGLAMTNSIATTVHDDRGSLLFDGQQRGICGAAIREASTEQVRMFAALIAARQLPLALIGVGGAATARDVADYLEAGAQAVHMATAAMVNPAVGIECKRELAALLV